jgi:hypothetical protein
MSELKAALEGLTTHPGYQLFRQEAKRRWGPVGYAAALHTAISSSRDGAAGSMESQILAVQRAHDEVNSLFAWVDDTIRGEQTKDEREQRGVSVSRRGPGL